VSTRDELIALRRAGAAAAALDAEAARDRAQLGHTHDGLPRKPARVVDRQSSVLPRLLTLRQAAGYLAVGYGTVRAWVDTGKLRAVRLPGGGKLLRIDRRDLDALIEACRE
jgi:excisionase family DNA binding protein